MDTIFVRGIEFYAYHGASEEERRIGHRYRVDAVLEFDTTRAAETDDLAETLDYARIGALVVEEGSRGNCRLVETVAERIAVRLLRETPANCVRIRLAKLFPPMPLVAEEAGVEIERRNRLNR